jgi:hypothetical protein
LLVQVAALRQAGRDDEASILVDESLAVVANNLRCVRYTASQCCTTAGSSWLLWMSRLAAPLDTLRRGDWLLLRAALLAAGGETPDGAVLVALRQAVEAGYSLSKMDVGSAAKKQAANKLVYAWPSFAGMAARLSPAAARASERANVTADHVADEVAHPNDFSAEFARLEVNIERNNRLRPRRKTFGRLLAIFVGLGWMCLLVFVLTHTVGMDCYSSRDCEKDLYCDRSPQCQTWLVWDCSTKCTNCHYLENKPCDEVHGDCCSAAFVANCPRDPANCSQSS